ncbi:SMI1/KNR4 family protein [Chitinilyticum litopenaei]|uniref:SMI1/KNR4 family protein n=1 Tax=Chitinilyticum litopenaei TaxID=1121276 RepID=UPI00118702F9|nr:SMI1/KNR4 family protein [Chitinilyticum litopenaei]
MNTSLLDLKKVQLASGKRVAECRLALDAAKGDVEDAIEILSRPQVPLADTPFDDSDWFTGPTLSRNAVKAAEMELGLKFPAAYLELLYIKNGGSTRYDCFAVDRPTSWARDHISITGIRGIGGKYGIDATSELKINSDWGYPTLGFVFAETPAAGHTVVMFDYSKCGPSGEPQVAWVDVYGEQPEVIILASSFSQFVSGLTTSLSFARLDEA